MECTRLRNWQASLLDMLFGCDLIKSPIDGPQVYVSGYRLWIPDSSDSLVDPPWLTELIHFMQIKNLG